MENSDIRAVNVMEARKILKSLYSEIARHNELYHAEDRPEISDAEFDMLTKRARDIEARFPSLARKDAQTQKVGATARKEFGTIVHARPMLSLDNCFSREDVEAFVKRIRKFLNLGETDVIEFTAEPKIDGLSLNVRYENGMLVSGTTRGDGTEGENVTANVFTITDIPKTIPAHMNPPAVLEVRGEVYMSKTEFSAINKELEAAGKQLYVNPRNTAAGTLRQLDATITAKRRLNFFAYGWGEVSEMPCATQSEMLVYFEECGFRINEHTKQLTDRELVDHYDHIGSVRPSLPYEIDGVVYKVNQIALQERLGYITRTPRWATAHKFPAELASSVLEDIEIQVGRTGALSPVGRITPVQVGGVLVSNVTLHNEDYIAGRDSEGKPIREGRDLRIGDTITIYRSGDVIPKVDDVDLEKRPADSQPYRFPNTCPVCGSPAVREVDRKGKLSSVRRCTGDLICDAQALETLTHVVSRECLDIEGLGGKQLEYFFHDKELPIKTVADIFTLADRDAALGSILRTRPGYKDTSVKKLFAAIDQKRTIPLDRAIYAMGIRQVGSSTSKDIAKGLRTWEATKTVFEGVCNKDEKARATLRNYVGEAAIDAIANFLAQPANQEIVRAFTRMVRFSDMPESDRNGPLAGKIVVFTGSFETMSRDEAKATAERLGAKSSSSVSKKTDIVVAGEKAGTKLDEARKHGVRIMTEQEWINLIQEP